MKEIKTIHKEVLDLLDTLVDQLSSHNVPDVDRNKLSEIKQLIFKGVIELEDTVKYLSKVC